MTGENLLKWNFNAGFNYQNSDFIQVFWLYYQNAEFYLTIQSLLAYSISELKFLWWIIYICTVDVQHFNSRQLFFLTPALPQLCPCSWLLYTKPFIAHLFFGWVVIVALNAALMWALILNECRCWTVWINKGNWNLKKTRGFDVGLPWIPAESGTLLPSGEINVT